MRHALLALPLLLLACAEPVTVVRTVDARPRLLIEGAPRGATLYIDGKPVGEADAFGGKPNVLPVEPGTHVIEVKTGDRLLLSQKVFLGGGEQRTLVIPREVLP